MSGRDGPRGIGLISTRLLSAAAEEGRTAVQRDGQKTGWPDIGIVFGIGFFGLAAQTLLFRAFFTVFEGNELGIACFFGSWLTWVAVGAVAARGHAAPVRALAERFPWLPLLYIPAFLLQWWLIGSAREMAGVARYEMFPLFRMLPVAFLANAPVSLCTGFLFTLGCRWFGARDGLPVARVYVWECAGSFVGGVAITCLLAAGVSAQALSLWSFLVVTVTVAACFRGQRTGAAAALPVAGVAAALLFGAAERWERTDDMRRFTRLLPPQAYRGAFVTPEAKHLYGEHNGQFNVVSWETIADTIPATEHASEIIALHLAQRPDARRFLVLGRGGFSICRRLTDLPQAEAIAWLDPDPAYAARLRSVLPERLKTGMERVEMPAEDIGRWLARSRASYDIIILNFPDATTLALNRYFTQEFFLRLKARLGPAGALGVRISAGENYMSEERVNAGASVFHTLRSVFRYMAIKPGEESWLIVSDHPGLTSAPAVLRERLAGVPGAESLYPAAGVMSLYLPQRTAYALDRYTRASRGADGSLLLNTERTPRALLHSLLFAAREAGAADSLGRLIRSFARHGLLVAPLGLLLFAVLRNVFRWRSGRAAGDRIPSRFDSHALVFATGAAGMGGMIVMMYMYQSAFGSIFLHAGLLSALYMLGLTIGGGTAARLLVRSADPAGFSRLLALTMALHVLLYAGMALLQGQASRAAFAAAFVLSGLLGGVYVPVAARRLNAAGVPHDRAGAAIEAADHIGGALGGLAVGLLLMPVFGTLYGLFILALLILVNVGAVWPWSSAGGEGRAGGDGSPARAVGYAVFGLVAFTLAAGLLLRRGGADESDPDLLTLARSAGGSGGLEMRRQSLAGGKTLRYVVVTDTAPGGPGAVRAYAFSTETLAPEISGYGGPLALAVLVAADGSIQRVEIRPCRETPAYLESLRPWLERLSGRNLFAPGGLDDVDAVTGATMTSAAVLRILRQAGPAFAREALGRDIGRGAPPSAGGAPRREGLWLAAAAAAALVLRARPSRWLRRGFLLAMVVAFGFGLNAQYSLTHVFSLLELRLPTLGWGAAFALAAGIPLLVALFGNVYCGYLCPFGALQEIVGELRPGSFRTDPDKNAWGRARFVKYGVLAVLLLLFGATLKGALASADPLVTVFARDRSRWILLSGILIAGLAFAYPRFWCRCLCPAGAFLALLNGIPVFRRFRPPVAPRACVFGVRHGEEMDCLCCDRCRNPGGREREAQARPAGWTAAPLVNAGLWAAALALGLLVIARALSWSGQTANRPVEAVSRSGSGMRAVDMRRLRHLIEQGKLSDHEARHYQAMPGSRSGP